MVLVIWNLPSENCSSHQPIYLLSYFISYYKGFCVLWTSFILIWCQLHVVSIAWRLPFQLRINWFLCCAVFIILWNSTCPSLALFSQLLESIKSAYLCLDLILFSLLYLLTVSKFLALCYGLCTAGGDFSTGWTTRIYFHSSTHG